MSSHRATRKRSAQAGFTLLEVLVAAGVASLVLTILVRTFGSVWGEGAAVRDTAEAMIVARAVMEEALPRATLPGGVRQGVAGRFTWTVATEKVADSPTVSAPAIAAPARLEAPGAAPAARPAPRPRFALYRIAVVVEGPRGRRTRLETLRMGPDGR